MGITFCGDAPPSPCSLDTYIEWLTSKLCVVGCSWDKVRCVPCGTPPANFADEWTDDGCATVPCGAMIVELCSPLNVFVYTGAVWQSLAATGVLPVGGPGDMLYHDGLVWTTLGPGSAGQVLQMSGGLPIWGPSPGVDATGVFSVQTEDRTVAPGATITDTLGVSRSIPVTAGETVVVSTHAAVDIITFGGNGSLASAQLRFAYTVPGLGGFTYIYNPAWFQSDLTHFYANTALANGNFEVSISYTNTVSVSAALPFTFRNYNRFVNWIRFKATP